MALTLLEQNICKEPITST